MAQIRRSFLDEYTRSLNGVSKAYAKPVEKAVLAVADQLADENGAVTHAQFVALRDAAIEILDQAAGTACELAAELSARFYDEIRSAAAARGTFRAEAASSYSHEATDRAVRALVANASEPGGARRFARDVAARVDYEVKRTAGDCVEKNARKDKRSQRWARVPTGAETCPFCLMLASRGFVYKSAKTAGQNNHYHANCDCRLVPGFDGMEVEGYDPQDCFDRWQQAVNPDD